MRKSVAVLGAGTMGRDIAQVFAQTGWDVKLFDVVPAAPEAGRAGGMVHACVDTPWGRFRRVAPSITTDDE